MSCPTPGKYRHADRAGAEKHLESLIAKGKADLNVRPYQCGDHWHIGHHKPDRKHQLKYALAAGRQATATTRRRRRR